MKPTLLIGLLAVAACAPSSTSSPGAGPSPAPNLSTSPPSPDPRVGLKAGWMNAQEATWNMRVVSSTPPSADFINPSTPGDFRLINSDLAMVGHYVFQGNFSGYQLWDISNPAHPTLARAYICPGSQSDVSVFRNLLFVSDEAPNGRVDCGAQGVADTVSQERARGIRLFDISDIAHPRPLTVVQTCRGSHTHTVVLDPNDTADIYIYVSGSAPVRASAELGGCTDVSDDPSSELFKIEVIQVPLAHPEQAHVVSKPPILAELAPVQHHGELPADSIAMAARRAAAGGPSAPVQPPQPPRGPVQCHDITAYPAIGFAAGACGGYGVLLDIRDPAHPRRLAAAADSNFAFWHSATFNNDGTKVLFTDEWGGGLQPRCRATDKYQWGADAIFTRTGDQMTFQSYYKMPAPQTPQENCVAHNGSLIPIPGRDIMAQGWYQGGVSVFEFTDPAHPREIAFFDRGPMDSTQLQAAGSWSAYWYNGYLISSEIARGLDILELTPSAFLSQNELEAAKTVHFDYLNVQDQPKFVWPPSFALARAYLDQLARSNGLAADRISATRASLTSAEKLSSQARREALTQLATQLNGEAAGAADQTKVHTLVSAIRDLATAQR